MTTPSPSIIYNAMEDDNTPQAWHVPNAKWGEDDNTPQAW